MTRATTDWAYRSAREVAAAIRNGELTSREHLELLLERVDERNEPLNVVVTQDRERARGEAEAADAKVRAGETVGPLHGVAMTIKDSFQTHGMRTTSGAPELADFIPEVDAVPVARLRAAGAVVYGKTNLPIYAGDAQSYNAVFGTSNNPWNLERSPGGSSGGAAAALAAGLTPIELGSDIGGSIRGPANDCGVVGHKPSYGIVPALGQIPGPPGTLTQADLAVAGPLARDVNDAELMLDVLSGPDAWHAPAYRLELPPPRQRRLADYRIGTWLDDPVCPVDPEVRGLLENAAGKLASAGARVDDTARPAFGLEKARDTFFQLLLAALSGGQPRERMEDLAKAEGAHATATHARYMAMRHREWLGSNERRLQLRQRWHEYFQDWDAILLPAMPRTAIPHDHSEPMASRTIEINGETRPYFDRMVWMGPAGLAYLPATVLPIGVTSEGLPVGMQIVGPFLEDRTPLDVARGLEALLGGFSRPPGY